MTRKTGLQIAFKKTTGILSKADGLIDLSINPLLKLNFNHSKLTHNSGYLSNGQTFLILPTEAMKILLRFTSSYLCEAGFTKW